MTSTVPPVDPNELNGSNLQSLVEIIYMGTANDVISGALQSLQSALGLTNKILNALNMIQSLHNQITVAARSSQAFQDAIAHGISLQDYTNLTSDYFGTPITPSANQFTQDLNNQLQSATKLLKDTLKLLSASAPASITDPNSLYATAHAVLSDLPTDANSFYKWVQDNYENVNTQDASNAGSIQQAIVTASTAASSLNNTQKEKVQNYLFVFEEYYKSAATIISTITQMISRMAQNIVGR